MAIDVSLLLAMQWPMIAIALVISAAVAAVAYMVSAMFNSSELRAWAKKEFNEFIFSVVIIAALVIAIVFADSIIASLPWKSAVVMSDLPFQEVVPLYSIDSGKPAHMEYAKAHLSQMNYLIYNSGFELTIEAAFYAVLAGLKFDLGSFIVQVTSFVFGPVGGIAGWLINLLNFIGIEIQPFSPLNNLTGVMTDLVKYIFTVFMLVVGQQKLLEFIEIAMLRFILPLGFVFRAFPLTRKTGSTLIALSLIAYFVYPASINVGGYMFDQFNSLYSTGGTTISKTFDKGASVAANDIPPLLTPDQASTTPARWTLFGSGKLRLWRSINSGCLSSDTTGKTWECICMRDNNALLCDVCHTQTLTSEVFYRNGEKPVQQPPFDPNNPGEYQKWVISYLDSPPIGQMPTHTVCYDFVRSEDYDSSKSTSLTHILARLPENKTYSFIVDVYRPMQGTGPGTNIVVPIYAAAGFDDVSVFIGDPKSSEWTAAQERMAKALEITKVNGVNSYGNFMTAMLQAVGGIAEDVSNVGKGTWYQATDSNLFDKAKLLMNPPALTAAIYLSFTERIPKIMIPMVIVLFTFVTSVIFTISAFKGISPAIGGEADIMGLGKLL